ncbi:MAG TPA: alpha-amylase family glycosyl hydrolase, partial [Candidatus Saccharimonadales bacterium]|nr:alpha-amylase family glycosyl hydrolase [Candidatus Saccharimonadales bacterium]
MHPTRRISAIAGTLLSLANLIGVQLHAQVGTNHPGTGAYSEVNPSGWGTATWPRGATLTPGAAATLEVGVYSANATNVILEIYTSDTGADAAYDYAMVKGGDSVWRAAVAHVPTLTLYAFRAWGPNWPLSSRWARGNSAQGFISDCDSSGNRFNPNKVLYDPYARELSHNLVTPALLAAHEGYGMFLSGGGSGQTYSGPGTGYLAIDQRNVDSGHWAPKSVALVDATSTGSKPNLNQANAIIYEAHLKGLTAHPSSVSLTTLLSRYSGFPDAANVPSNLLGTYAGAAYMAGYLKDLGINTIEFMPLQETNNAANSTTAPNAGGGGYWAYWTYGFFAPDRRYASNQAFGGPTAEFKQMVAAFHKKGIEVYLDVVYNHFGEGGTQDD